jgi:cytoskeletal protein CcmA (bactofilin family)
MSRDFGTSKSHGRGAASSSSEQNVLGRGVRIRGRVNGVSNLRIDGDIEGDVKIDGAIDLGESGSVTGNLTAKSVAIEGSLAGNVEASGSVVIRAGARVTGDMNGSEVALEEGAAFTGRIEADFELPDGLGSPSGAASPANRSGRRGR